MKLSVCFERKDSFFPFQVSSLTNLATIETEHDVLPVDLWQENHNIANNVQYAHRCAKLLTPYRWRQSEYSAYIASEVFFHHDPRFVIDRAAKDKPVTVLINRQHEAILFFNNRMCEGILTPDNIDRVYRENGSVMLTDFFDRKQIACFPGNFYNQHVHYVGSSLFSFDSILEIDQVEKIRVFGIRNGLSKTSLMESINS